MIMDRISRGFTDQKRLLHTPGPVWHRHRFLLAALTAVAVFYVLALAVPFLRTYPKDWIFFPAGIINDGLTYVTVNFPHVTDAIKNTVLFFFL